MDNPRVRLILCDVDGTLLKKGQTAVSDSVFHSIRFAVSCGVRFVIASGRSYASLKQLFAPVENIVSFVCCDGALVVNNGKVVYQAAIEQDLIFSLCGRIQFSEHESPVLYGKDDTYCFGENKELENFTPITAIDEVFEKTYKLAFFNLSDCTKQRVKRLAALSGKLSEVYSDRLWTEFVSFHVDKGSAAAVLQKMWSISPSETAAFGDNTNDFGMLRRARLSFASPAAVPDVKRMCKYQADSITDEILTILQER